MRKGGRGKRLSTLLVPPRGKEEEGRVATVLCYFDKHNRKKIVVCV